MDRVLILTKNILTEQELQNKLQLLNYEVYCSVKMFDDCIEQKYNTSFFELFQYVILSENINESEITLLMTILKKLSIRIIRKVGLKITDDDQRYFNIGLSNAIISVKDSPEELRECLALCNSLTESEEFHKKSNDNQLSRNMKLLYSHSLQSLDDEIYINVLQKLSQAESMVLHVLIKAGNQILSREKICHEIWGGEVTNSQLSSLSSKISRINSKFEQTPLKGNPIRTLWGKGYRIDQDLLNKLKSNDELISYIKVE